MKNFEIVAVSLAVLMLATTPTAAMEWLNSSELEQSCDSFLADTGSNDGMLCLAYLQGFIAGSDAGRAKRTSGKENESFADRATRTRLATLRMQQIRKLGGHCMGDDVAALSVVEKVADYLKSHPETLELTNAEALRRALAHHYPCPK